MDFTAIITELGIDKLPEEEQQIVFRDMFESLQAQMSLRLSKVLTEDQIKELEHANTLSDEEGQKVLDRVCPNYNEMYREELDKLKNDIKQTLGL